MPLADGGEGTLDAEAASAARSGVRRSPIRSGAAWRRGGSCCRMGAESSSPRRPSGCHSSRQVSGIRWWLRAGASASLSGPLAEEARELLVGLGDSATVDGGGGLREVLDELPAPTTVLCDVRNPLLDAARVFAAQKGASSAQIQVLEARLLGMRELQRYAETPGAGAAGGLGAAFAAVGAALVPGADYVIDAAGLREQMLGADLVVTGEGVVDRTSMEGKLSGTVAALCSDLGVRCAVFGGRVDEAPPGAEIHELSGELVPELATISSRWGELLGRSL